MRRALVLVSLLLLPSWLFAEYEEDLLFMDIPPMTATLTDIESPKIPASITVINEEDIALAPARNIYDLIEIYVPGAFWMNHHESPHPAIRGIISDRNFKFLLLVNGVNMNQKAHGGALAELENWDMNDIAKIEIVRGPGSVTYGPGAVEGIISITTKDAVRSPGTTIGGQYVSKYGSMGTHYSQGLETDAYKFYVYGSMAQTPGLLPAAFTCEKTNSATLVHGGYVGASGQMGNTKPPLDYMRDYNDVPQMKFYTQLDFLKEWKLWGRYTNSGATRNGINTKFLMNTGDYANLKESQIKQYTIALENNHKFSDVLNLRSNLIWGSQHHSRRDNENDNTNIDNAKNYLQNFAESTLTAQSIAKYSFSENYNVALGAAYEYNLFGPGWGDNPKDFRMGESDNITGASIFILNGTNSNSQSLVGASEVYYVGDSGWSTDTYSFFGEANLAFDPKLNLLISARTDQNQHSQLLFSPRVAAISDVKDIGIFKLIWQESVRMNTAEILYMQSKAGLKSDPEKLSGIEFIYDSVPVAKDVNICSSLFYNSVQILGWNSAKTTTALLGTLSLYGIEVEARYSTDKLKLGLSQSYVKQKDYTLEPGIPASGISYADYDKTLSGITLTGQGNDLNNWYNCSTKATSNYKATRKITLFAAARLFWGMQGAKDGLAMLKEAVKGTANQTAVDNAIAAAEAQNPYDTDFRLDMSARYQVTDPLSLTLFIQNLAGINNNKRYSYDAGVAALSPHRLAWVEEPAVFGLRMDCRF